MHSEKIKMTDKENKNVEFLVCSEDEMWEHSILHEKNKSIRDKLIINLSKKLKGADMCKYENDYKKQVVEEIVKSIKIILEERVIFVLINRC